MASEVDRLIQDLNLNNHSNGAFVVGKDDVLKKGFGGSKVYGDLSKCGKPSMTEASQKQPSVVGKDDVLKKGFGGSKVYGDLSKCGKPSMTEASQKQPSVVDDFNSKRKGGAVIEEDIADEDIAGDDFADKLVARTRIDINDIPEEEFLEMIYEHDHNKCIESQKKAASNLFHASENKVEDIPLDLDWEEFDGSEMLEALESMNESEFMEALESLDESEYVDIFEPTIVTRPSTWMPKCANKWIPICPNTLSPKCPNTLSPKCPNTLCPKCV